MKNENHIEFGAKSSAQQLSIKESSPWNVKVIPLGIKSCKSTENKLSQTKTPQVYRVKVKEHNNKSKRPILNLNPTRLDLRTPLLLVRQSVVMLLTEQCWNAVFFVLCWTEKSELCYYGLHEDNERRREQLLGLFLFLFQALTLLLFLLIKLLERGAGLTGPCLAGRQRVNGPKLNRRHLWVDLSHCFPHQGSFQTCRLCLSDLYNRKNAAPRTQSQPQRAAPQNMDFTALGQIRTLPRFHR